MRTPAALRTTLAVAAAAAIITGAARAAGPGAATAAKQAGAAEPKTVTLPSGLKYVDLEVGTGVAFKNGMLVLVDYEAWLADGTKFDSSYDRREPFNFKVGAGQVIQGWDEGVVGMKVGGKRRLIIPPVLGYGEAGAPPRIPPNATLTFEVKALAAQ
jgi:peptidylprolyl isomerase